jgi:hypothetical protein
MCGPPDPERERGAAANDTPNPQIRIEPHHLAEAASDLQAQKLRQLYSFCQATACTVAALAYGVCR